MVKNRQGRLCLCGLQKYAAFHKGSLTGGIAVVLAVMMLGSHLARAVVHASIVVDAHSGTVIEAYNSEVPVHPASLAKLMTLYITFQELKDGKLSLNEELPVSAHAASQEPTKLWLRPGSKVSVRSCILGITTRSANDAAVVLAEAIGGSESSFAQRMTATAHWLGMTHTTFRNATGLPDPPDWTTAHDMARLAIALINGFPQYYHFFSARSFQFRGRTIYTLDNLLYEYRGADGLKTGYITASGFNLVTSAVRNDRRLVGVVFGGRTAWVTNHTMMALLNRGFASAKPAPEQARATPPPAVAAPRPAVAARPKQAIRLVSATEDQYAGNADSQSGVIQVGGDFANQWSVRRVLGSAILSAPGWLSPANELVVKLPGQRYLARFWHMSGNDAMRACGALRAKGFTCSIISGPASPDDVARISGLERP